jgi:hypothetical protein
VTRLSENFGLEEFLQSRTASLHGIDMTPPSWVVDNLQRLVDDCLQPIRSQLYSPVIITSGYRPKKLNKLINGSKKSAHMSGRAADIRIVGYTPYQAIQMIEQMSIPYDQLINEFQSWIHIGIAESEPRGELLTAGRVDNAIIYQRGNLNA